KGLKQALDESQARSEALARELASARENEVAARNLTAVRERENAAQTSETKQIADATKGLKQELDESQARSEALARELASARESEVAARNLAAARERENAVLETKQIADAKQKELQQALDESEKRAPTLDHGLTSAHQTIASAEQPSNAEVTARDAVAPTGPLNRPTEQSNAASEITSSMTTPQSRGNVTAGVQASSDATPDDATAGASGRLARSTQSEPSRPQPPSAMSSAEEAKFVARAESLIKQFDFVGARLLLGPALEKGSARAAFMMAETYDQQILRSLQAYGVRGDAQMAREFYQLAAAAGIEKARERVEALQAQQRLQPNGHAQPNALVQPNAQAQRGERRNGVARVTPQAAQQGRFAARFAARAQGANVRAGTAALAPRRAWSLGLRAAFVPWHGPVFWPYAYSDVFDYAFRPSGYDDGYFAYAYDDFIDGVFWGQAGPPPEYSYAYAPPNARLARSTSSTVEELCTQPGTGITAWPFAEIKSKVGLNTEQKQLLDQVRSSGQRAASVFKASCPAKNAFAMTPPGRLQAMTLRLTATLEAVQTVRPAMEKFYNSLSDGQNERLNEIGPKQPKNNAEADQTSARDGKSCSEPKAGLANLPIERIEDAVKPTNAQEDGLEHLEKATVKAVSIMQAACPEDTPITPPGRLEAMEKRLQAMIDAANTVKAALYDFYGSLSNEQKARFNIIGGELAQSGN
ncbi:MAG TPA: Spy/CpxP family protein refolding chaperone, partial [Bradyrhizobium sp.]|nr:Spy/CpxP family protein refolding chaperone [Bradyrhizobium sp.]